MPAPAAVGPEHVIAFLQQFTHLSHETRHRFFREVRRFFRWAQEAGYLDHDPFRGLRNVRLPQKIVQPFTPHDVRALLDACLTHTPAGRRDVALILTLLDTGIRCAECVALDRADCDLAAGRLHIRQGKGQKERVVAFAGRCRAALAAYLRDRGDTPGPLFVRSQFDGALRPGERLEVNGFKHLLRRLGRRAGVPKVHAHRFRHTFATWAIQHDARELDVQHLLGHASPDMVRRYSTTYGAAQAAQRHVRFSPADQMLVGPAER